MVRQRMTGERRREQLISVGRALFAERGFEGSSVEEIAARAGVSKPVVYEHFGGKDGLYAAVVERDMQALQETMQASLAEGTPRKRIESAVLSLLTYIEENSDGFQILVRDMNRSDAPVTQRTYSTFLNNIVGQVSHILATSFEQRGFDPDLAVIYGQMLVGMVSMPSQWWLDARQPSKEVVATHIVNLCWNGLARLEKNPQLTQQGDE